MHDACGLPPGDGPVQRLQHQVHFQPGSFGQARAFTERQQMDRGLLVTELLGHGVNYVTGDYSRGAAGFWVEKGRIKHPVEEITIAGYRMKVLSADSRRIHLLVNQVRKSGEGRAVRAQLQQVMMNLCVNAKDAMPEGGVLRASIFSAHTDAHIDALLGELKKLV